jgi:hypothetical protein
LAPSSFGLNPDNKEIIYTEIFELVMHCQIPYDTAWNMPVMLRHWWFEQVKKLREEQARKGAPPGGHTDPFGKKHA